MCASVHVRVYVLLCLLRTSPPACFFFALPGDSIRFLFPAALWLGSPGTAGKRSTLKLRARGNYLFVMVSRFRRKRQEKTNHDWQIGGTSKQII